MSEEDRWLYSLKAIARKRRYNNRWVGYTFEEKFGHWPDSVLLNEGPRVEPDEDVLDFVEQKLERFRAERLLDVIDKELELLQARREWLERFRAELVAQRKPSATVIDLASYRSA
jgi:hypothetical protein